MIEFAWPLSLLLLPLPLLVRWLVPAANKQQAALRVPFYQQVVSIGGQSSGNKDNPLRGWNTHKLLSLLIWLCLIAAATKPQWIGEAIELPTSGRDLMLAVDISGSMKMEDMQLQGNQATRLAVVKQVVAEFIERRRGDRIGLILFGTQAYLQAPLTFDRNTVATLLTEAQIGFAGEKTAIGDAIGLAVKRLRERPEQSRLLILLTDGANTAGEIEPLKASELAQQLSVKIHTIGVGAETMELPGLFGSGFGARTINPSADLDEESLLSIADSTGGRYFRAHDINELEQIYGVIDQMEPIEQEAETYNPVRSLYMWPLGLALLMTLIMVLIRLLPAWLNRRRFSHHSVNNPMPASMPTPKSALRSKPEGKLHV